MEKGCLNTFLVIFELKYLGDHKVALGLMMILNAIWNIKDEVQLCDNLNSTILTTKTEFEWSASFLTSSR